MSDINVGDKLRYLRESNKYNISQIAEYLDLNENDYLNMENNKYPINLTLLKKICALYYIDPDFLSKEDNIYSPPKIAFKTNNIDLKVIGKLNQTMKYVEMLKNIDTEN